VKVSAKFGIELYFYHFFNFAQDLFSHMIIFLKSEMASYKILCQCTFPVGPKRFLAPGSFKSTPVSLITLCLFK